MTAATVWVRDDNGTEHKFRHVDGISRDVDCVRGGSIVTKKKGDKPSELDLRDERILAEIIAWAEQHEQALGFAVFGGSVFVTRKQDQWREADLDGPCCAVGAAILSRGFSADDHYAAGGSLGLFAKRYGVSVLYASGVSAGFESVDPAAFGDDEDYARGLSVGIAAREWAESMGRR